MLLAQRNRAVKSREESREESGAEVACLAKDGGDGAELHTSCCMWQPVEVEALCKEQEERERERREGDKAVSEESE